MDSNLAGNMLGCEVDRLVAGLVFASGPERMPVSSSGEIARRDDDTLPEEWWIEEPEAEDFLTALKCFMTKHKGRMRGYVMSHMPTPTRANKN